MHLVKISVMMIAIILLLQGVHSQQICLRQECKNELAACDSDCTLLMTKCTFDCTLNSLGCLQQCIGQNKVAQNLLECSFNKCIFL